MSLYVHRVPGRIRVRARALRKQNSRVEALCRALEALEGVAELAHNPKTGSLVIHYRCASCEAPIEACLECLGELPTTVVAEPSETRESEVVPPLGRTLVNTLVQTVSQQLARRLIERALFGAR